ncbi:MAG: CvpA family protein [Parvibaculaceae bacterium]|nr:CvpA family protein [Parvibaculaceae bacterium]
MTPFDLILLVIILISGVLAMTRGFTSEVLSILAWVVAAIVALKFYPLLTPYLHGLVTPEWLASVAAAAGLFIVVFIAVSMLSFRWNRHVHAIHRHAGLLDRTFGFIFGIARGVLIVSIGYLFFTWLVPNQQERPEWLTQSKFTPLLEQVSTALFSLAPATGQAASSVLSPAPSTPYSPSTDAPSAPQGAGNPTDAAKSPAGNSSNGNDTNGNTGYNSAERRGMDRLFDSTTGN